ncbi:MAG: 3-deoxy-7-phosphoheptulonate synthase [Elusimicrobia bacterium RIFOXYB2_FULL_49_7]|nr:MAG: 3-deoxy-7-phosphoheptulonate synthase [Elusimicrobia bacterium RIFOXYB2_FULL_49_7]
MIIVMKPSASKREADDILAQISGAGLKPLYMPGTERVVLGALGDERTLYGLHLENNPAVERITPVLSSYKLVSREAHPKNSVFPIGPVSVGGSDLAIIAGPCAVENPEQMATVAAGLRKLGIRILRGGAFKPRTSPYSFQGLGLEGLKILKAVSVENDMACITEVVEVADVETVIPYVDALQVGARNMQNFRLLTILGKAGKPVLLKRGMSATVEDLLLAAEYIVSEGNPQVILCERGLRTFETAYRNTLDLNAIPFLKLHSHLPVMVDPSHGTGIRELVSPMSRAAVACGADGLIVEVHPSPKTALSDGAQSLDLEQFARFLEELKPFAVAAGKTLK